MACHVSCSEHITSQIQESFLPQCTLKVEYNAEIPRCWVAMGGWKRENDERGDWKAGDGERYNKESGSL